MWFQDYKIPDGKPANKFGFDNQPQNKEFTLNVRPAFVILQTRSQHSPSWQRSACADSLDQTQALSPPTCMLKHQGS